MLRDLETGAARAGVSLQLDVLNGDVVSTILVRAAELPADIISLGH